MRLARFVLSFVLILAILGSSPRINSQQSVETPQRDPYAIQVLNQCLVAAGGMQALSGIQDYTATGTVTYFWAGGPDQGSATVRGRGTGQFRFDASLPTGQRFWTVSKSIGSAKEIDGTLRSIPYHNAIHLGSLTFPFPKVLAALQDSSWTISDMGVVEVSGRQANRIGIRKNLVAKADPSGLLTRLTAQEFFVDTVTSQLLRTVDMVHPEKKSTVDYQHEVEFSDYRVVSGLLVPLSITESIGGVKLWTLQLNQINFNTGLRDSDFLP